MGNLMGLTTGIPIPYLDDIPWWIQSHTMGVEERFDFLIWKVARVVVCSHKNKVPQE